VATSVLFGWYAFSQGRVHQILLFSLFVSLTYLTRPEGIGLLFVFVVWVLLINPPHVRRNWTNRAGIIFLSIFCFLLFSSPYLIQLRKELGKWEISKKASISMESIPEEDASLEAVGTRDKINILVLLKDPLTLLGKIGMGLLESFYKFQQGYNPILFFLAILGWIRIFRLKSSHALKANFYILSHHIFFFAFVLPFFWVTRRYTSHMVSISIPWAAFGCLEVLVWINRWFEKESLRKKLSVILLLLLLGGLFVQGRVVHSRENRMIRREAGLWMKKNLPRGFEVMSRLPQEAFYAELPWIEIPNKSYEEILRVARSSGVKCLVIDEDIEKGSPDFLRKIKVKDLILLKELRRRNQKIAIYEIVYSE
jgi:hypothetical protein